MIQGQCILHGTEWNGSPTRRKGMTGLWRDNVQVHDISGKQKWQNVCQFHHLWEAGLKREVLVSCKLIMYKLKFCCVTWGQEGGSTVVCGLFCVPDSCTSYESKDVMHIAAASQRRCVPPTQTKENEASSVLFALFWCIIPQLPHPTSPHHQKPSARSHRWTLLRQGSKAQSGERVHWFVEWQNLWRAEIHAILTMRSVVIFKR